MSNLTVLHIRDNCGINQMGLRDLNLIKLVQDEKSYASGYQNNGGLMGLVAMGAQDVYLCEHSPIITFHKITKKI